MIFDFIKDLLIKEKIEINFSKKPEDLEYFFKPLNKRGQYNHGLIACFNSFDDNTKKFIKKYTDEANSNGVISKDYLDTIPQNKELMEKMDEIMDETEEYSEGLVLFDLFENIDLDVLKGISYYASIMLNYFSFEYQEFARRGDNNIYMNEGWYIVGQFFNNYYKILQFIPKAKRNKYPLKFLYYGCPTNSAFFFFYILIKNYCDVVVISPSDYDYKKVASPFLHNWIKHNKTIDSFERM